MLRTIFWRLLLILPLAAALFGQSPESLPASRPKSLAEAVEAHAAERGWVGLAWRVDALDGRSQSGFVGYEDREAKVPVTAETRFRWASISKPVTAVAALLLVEDGKLNLDADVTSIVPEFPKQAFAISSRQLLCHQGGIVHYENGKVVKLPPPPGVEHPYADVVRALDTFKNSSLIAEPGTAYNYSTHGFMLQSAVVQKASGVPFAEFVKTRIATPAHMTAFQPDYQWEMIPHRAKGYRKSGKRLVPSTDTDVSWKLGGGGFISPIGDLAAFGKALLGGKLLSESSFRAMTTAQRTRDGKPTTYGLGLGVTEAYGQTVYMHSGSQEKTATRLVLLPKAGIVISLMCNTEGAELETLAALLVKDRPWTRPDFR